MSIFRWAAAEKEKVRMLINTFIIFLLSGLWHGAAWTYVVWGCDTWYSGSVG